MQTEYRTAIINEWVNLHSLEGPPAMSRFTLACLLIPAALALALPARSGSGPISIEKEEIPLQTALDELAARSKIPVLNKVEDNPKLKLNVKQATFWEALDQIALAAGAQLDLYQADGGIALVRRSRDRDAALTPPISHSGPFRVALDRVSTHIDFRVGSRHSSAVCQLAWEPGTEVFYLQSLPQKLVIQDDRGNTFEGPAGSKQISVDSRRAILFDFDLPSLPRAAQQMKLFKGVVSIRGTNRMHTFRFPTPANREPTLAEHYGYLQKEMKEMKPLEESAGNKQTVCALQRVTLNADSWRVQVATTLPAGGPSFESNEQWYVNNEVYLQSLDGKTRLRWTVHSQESSGERKAVINYTFKNPPPGKIDAAKKWLLIVRAPASMIEQDVPFEFKDVPLP
jgi:hypothetical protein